MMESTKSSRSSSPANELRLEEWTPEPLVPDIDTSEYQQILKPHIVTSKPSKYMTVDGKECLNLGTHDYLGLADHPRLEQASIEAARKYGVGSCGPRAFYGTMDVHLKLEEELAGFLGVQEAILYSFGFSTIASAIPAYAKPGDIVFVDEQCNFPIQQGIKASKSRVVPFRHNEPKHLEEKVQEIIQEQINKYGKPKKVRTFLILEGIYAKTGQLCQLREFVKIAKHHKIRLFIDETRSFGVLGREGKGITQELNIDVKDIDLFMSSLENALCAFGGFCAGSSFVVDHQRLAGSGYCFSASLPPLQTRVALESLGIIQEDPSIVKTAQNIFKYADQVLEKLTHLQNTSHSLSPIKLLIVKAGSESSLARSYSKIKVDILDEICCKMLTEENMAISVSKYMPEDEMSTTQPSIRLVLNGSLVHEDIDRIFSSLESTSLRVFADKPIVTDYAT